MGDTCTYTYTPTLRGAPIHDILSDEVRRYVNFSHKIHVQSNIRTYPCVCTYICSHFTTLLQMLQIHTWLITSFLVTPHINVALHRALLMQMLCVKLVASVCSLTATSLLCLLSSSSFSFLVEVTFFSASNNFCFHCK